MNNKVEKIICNERLLVAGFFTLLVLNGLGQVMRWDLNQLLGMADHLYYHGSLYPDNIIQNGLTHPISIYPPGVSLIAFGLLSVGFNAILPEVMLILASVVILLMIYLMRIIISEWVNTETFIPFTIVSFSFLLNMFLLYSTEFKPDTIAFFISFLGLYLFWKYKNLSTIFIGSVLVASGLLFKQQQISILVGIILFSVFNYKDKKVLAFAFSSLLFSCFILSYYFSNKVLHHYIIDLVSNDGWVSVKTFFKFVYLQVKRLVLFAPIFMLLLDKDKIRLLSDKQVFSHSIPQKVKNCFRQPWGIILIIIFGVSVLGAAKVGGNTGNIQVGVFFLIPLLYFLIDFKKKNYIFSVAWISLFLILPLDFVSNYPTYLKGKKIITNVMRKNKVDKIVVGSNAYSLVRQNLNAKIEVIDFWMPSTLNDEYPNLSSIKNRDGIDLIIYNLPLSTEDDFWVNSHYQLIFEKNDLKIYKK